MNNVLERVKGLEFVMSQWDLLDCIKRLEFVVSHWDELEYPNVQAEFFNTFGDNFYVVLGLCYNCSLSQLPKTLLAEAFKSFEDFTGDMAYPICSESDYNDLEIHKFKCEKRKKFAIHCLNFLKAFKSNFENKLNEAKYIF